MGIDKEEQLLKKRISELAQICYQRDIPTSTDFLNLNEQTIFHSLKRSLPPVRYVLAGGYEAAERKIVCFLPSYEENMGYLPVKILKIMPINLKFAEELTHRDYLGALMNLGIERNMLGDIVINEDGCFIFCLERMADFISGELRQVRHTSISCHIVSDFSCDVRQKYEEIRGSIASPRLDNVLAMVYHSSRNKILPYIQGEKVFIDGRLTVSPSVQLKGGEIVSVRGMGKFLFSGTEQETRKGRIFVAVKKYC